MGSYLQQIRLDTGTNNLSPSSSTLLFNDCPALYALKEENYQMADVEESDKLSCLPDHLIDCILSRLSIKEAGRTSVLSTNWMNKWSTQPNLLFDRQCVYVIDSYYRCIDPSVIQSNFSRIIDHVLLHHPGPINKFEVSDSGYDLIGVNSMVDIDRWILHVTRRSIKDFVLDICLEQRYKIPWCLFSCQTLQHLNLYCCSLEPPTTFKGFKNLKSLDLNQVTITQDAFENLISGSPLLEKLTLTEVDGLIQINIHAPNLKFFHVVGQFEDISFENCFKLTNVLPDLNIYLNSESIQSRLHGCSSNLLKYFVRRRHIQSLVIGNYFSKYFIAGVVPVKLPTPFINLRSLSLSMNFNDLKEISAVLSLLKSSPNIRKLKILAQTEEQNGHLSSASCCWKDIFSRPATPLGLRHVRMENISGAKFELKFIKFLLLYSPVLGKMIVKPSPLENSLLGRKVLKFRRASSEARVIRENSS